MTEHIFKNRKLNTEKLLSFGFERIDNYYVYHTSLIDRQMELTVKIDNNEKVYTKVIDNSSKDEYVLHLVAGATGSFVGRVKHEYKTILDKISEKCFEPDIFQSRQAKSVIDYIKDRYGNELEYLWQKFPNNAVVRRSDNKKWYAVILTVSRRKLGFDSDEIVEILDLRMTPEDIEKLVDGRNLLPGYHMNKKHWITICFDDTVPLEDICSLIDNSYHLAVK